MTPDGIVHCKVLYNARARLRRAQAGRWCFGKTPMQTFLDAMPMTKEKMIAARRAD
jgi:hypothetical protein